MRRHAVVSACALLCAWRPNPVAVTTKWYENGVLAEERGYSHGEKTGVHRGWWPNGTRQFECRFDDGRAVGTCRDWYSNGALATVHRYVAGAEQGLQQGWSPSGSLQFSYVMRDGRRYGLLGSMACKTGARAAGEL